MESAKMLVIGIDAFVYSRNKWIIIFGEAPMHGVLV